MKGSFNPKEVVTHRLRTAVLEVIETAMLNYRKKQIDGTRIRLLYRMYQR